MVKLIIAAAVALVGVVAGGVAAQIDAPSWLIAVAGMAGTAGAALGGPAAIAALVGRIPKRVRDEIVAYGVVAIGVIQGGQLAAFNLPAWLHVTIGVLILLAGLLGIRSQATPLSNPRDQDGIGLVPSWLATTSTSSGTLNVNSGAAASPSTSTTRAGRR